MQHSVRLPHQQPGTSNSHSHCRNLSVATNAVASPSRAAAEETARKAAAVRETLRQQASRHARQIHEHNVHIAELQQQALRAHQQQQQQQQQATSTHRGDTLEDSRQQQRQEQQQQRQEQQLQQPRLPFTLRNRPHAAEAAGQQHQQPHEQHLPVSNSSSVHDSEQEVFYELLQGVELMVRSDNMASWQEAARQCQLVLLPSVSGPMQAADAWRVMHSLSSRRLSPYGRGCLGAAVAGLVQMSLAHNDFSMLQRLLALGSRRFSLGPRQLRDLIAVAAAAGAETDMLTALLDFAPPSQLSSRAFFVATLTSLNRRHYKQAQQCLTRLQDLGLTMSPALTRLQHRVDDGLSRAAAAAAAAAAATSVTR